MLQEYPYKCRGLAHVQSKRVNWLTVNGKALGSSKQQMKRMTQVGIWQKTAEQRERGNWPKTTGEERRGGLALTPLVSS